MGDERPPKRRLRGLWTARRGSLVLVLALVLAACAGGADGGAPDDTVPPNVVPEGASAWESITVRATAGGREAEVPPMLRERAAPLLSGRLLAAPESPSAYGLDSPVATLTYVGESITRRVVVGGRNFDGHGYYVQRRGDPRVFLVPADQLDPLLALVGTGSSVPPSPLERSVQRGRSPARGA